MVQARAGDSVRANKPIMGENVDVLGKINARGRIAEPREIAEVVLFLVDPRSSYVNGTNVVANGGERSALPV